MRHDQPYPCTFLLLLSLCLAVQWAWPDSCQASENKSGNSRVAEQQALVSQDQEQEVDLDEEEILIQDRPARPNSAAGTHHGGHFVPKGLKLFVDLLMEIPLGEDSFAFTPHHTYVILQAQVTDNTVGSCVGNRLDAQELFSPMTCPS